MRYGHDGAPACLQRFVDLLPAVVAGAALQLHRLQAAHEHEVGQHPTVVPEGAAGNPGHFRVSGVQAQDPGIVTERVPALGRAGQVPSVAAGARQPIPDAGRQGSAQPGRELVASGEGRQETSPGSASARTCRR